MCVLEGGGVVKYEYSNIRGPWEALLLHPFVLLRQSGATVVVVVDVFVLLLLLVVSHLPEGCTITNILTLAADRCFYVRPSDRGSKKRSIYISKFKNELYLVSP